MPVERSIFQVKTRLLMEQLAPVLFIERFVSEAKRLSFSAKAIQLMRRRRQRQARKGLVRKSLSRRFKIARIGVNRRKLTARKAMRKRNLTRRTFRKKHK